MKLIGLVPVRNSAGIIAQCLEALALLCDEIIVLDDCSDDHTVEVIKKLPARVKVSSVLTKTTWHRDEPGDRNRLLQEGRRLGGTHFAMIDADEMFTAAWVTNGSLRKQIAQLPEGGQLSVRWIHPWRSLDYVRWDDSIQTQQFKDVIFCDNGHAVYESDFIHTQRSPTGLKGPIVHTDLDEGLLHFQYVNWRNVLIKQAWYHCLERVRVPERPIKTINGRYKASCDETGLRLRTLPTKWLQAYGSLDRKGYDMPDDWRLQQMLGWFREHGIDHFRKLDIWNPEIWLSPTPEIAAILKPIRAPIRISLSDSGAITTAQKWRSELANIKKQLSHAEFDRLERGKVIEAQGKKLTKLEGEFDARLKELEALYASAETIKNERNLLQAQLADLQANFTAVENDRTERGKVIEAQGKKLTKLEGEFDARLTELKALYASAETIKNERNLLQAQLADLQANFTAVENDRIARGKVIERQGERIVELEKLVWLTEQNRDYWKNAIRPSPG